MLLTMKRNLKTLVFDNESSQLLEMKVNYVYGAKLIMNHLLLHTTFAKEKVSRLVT